MPRSKLGLKLPVEKILAKHKCNPVALLAEQVMEKKDGKWVLDGRDRLMAIFKLMDFQKPKPKPQEIVTDTDRSIQIVRQSFTLPAPANGTVIADLNADKDSPPPQLDP